LIYLEEILPRLRRVPWPSYGVKWVVLFGSLRARRGDDIDLLIYGVKGSKEKLVLVLRVSEDLGISPDEVDVVPADDSTPCPVILDAWRYGKIVYARDPGEPREWLLRKTMICYDYSIMSKKLEIVRTATRAARKR